MITVVNRPPSTSNIFIHLANFGSIIKAFVHFGEACIEDALLAFNVVKNVVADDYLVVVLQDGLTIAEGSVFFEIDLKGIRTDGGCIVSNACITREIDLLGIILEKISSAL
jgi:hypothetical protein